MPTFKRPTQAEYEAIFQPVPPTEQVVRAAVRDGQLAPLALAASVAGIARAAPRVMLQGLTAAHSAIEAIAFAPVMFGQHLAQTRRAGRAASVNRALDVLGIPAEQWQAMRERTMFGHFERECRATWQRNARMLKRLTGEDVGPMPAGFAQGKWDALLASRRPAPIAASLVETIEQKAPTGPLSPEAEIAATVQAIVLSGAHAPVEASASLDGQQAAEQPASEAASVQVPATPEDTMAAVIADTVAGMQTDGNALLARLDATVAPLGAIGTDAGDASANPLTHAESAVIGVFPDGTAIVTDVPADVVAKFAEAMPEQVALVQADAGAIAQAAAASVGSVAETVAPASVAVVEPVADIPLATPDSPAKIAAQSAICDAGRAFQDKPSTPLAAEYRKVTKAAFKAGFATAEQFAKVKAETAPYVQQKRGVKGGK